jgi:hypothetical protein
MFVMMLEMAQESPLENIVDVYYDARNGTFVSNKFVLGNFVNSW